MSELLREGLEARLVILEDLVLEDHASLDDAEPTRACASCYSLEDECFCPAPVLWPLAIVARKLRSELALST
jgi:hypothetical protein